MSTSVNKTGSNSNNYLNTKDNYPSNQSDTNKASYKINYPTYKRGGDNLNPNYAYGNDSDNNS